MKVEIGNPKKISVEIKHGYIVLTEFLNSEISNIITVNEPNINEFKDAVNFICDQALKDGKDKDN